MRSGDYVVLHVFFPFPLVCVRSLGKMFDFSGDLDLMLAFIRALFLVLLCVGVGGGCLCPHCFLMSLFLPCWGKLYVRFLFFARSFFYPILHDHEPNPRCSPQPLLA